MAGQEDDEGLPEVRSGKKETQSYTPRAQLSSAMSTGELGRDGGNMVQAAEQSKRK